MTSGAARRRSRSALVLAFALLSAASWANASSGGAPAAAAPTTKTVPARGRELIVFEAASLKNAFARLAAEFQRQNPGVEIVANAAGSQELRAQIEHGAAADVFASADSKHMDALSAAKLVATPAYFACNEPVIVVRAGLAATVRTLGDLTKVERLVVGAPEVPIGSYTRQILANASRGALGADFAARVEAKVVSREPNVRQVLAKVMLGEADAGIVYRSDVLGAKRDGPDKTALVSIPADVNVIARYPIARVAAARESALANKWIELVRSPAGARVLHDAGFVACSDQR